MTLETPMCQQISAQVLIVEAVEPWEVAHHLKPHVLIERDGLEWLMLDATRPGSCEMSSAWWARATPLKNMSSSIGMISNPILMGK